MHTDTTVRTVATVAALAGAIVMDQYHTRRNRKLIKAATNYVNQLEEVCELRDQQVQYLIEMIKRADEFDISDFDAIALQELQLIKKD